MAMEPRHGEAFPHSMPRRMRRGEGEGEREGEGEVKGRGKGRWRVKEKVEETVGRVGEEWLKEELPVGCHASLNASKGSPSFTTKQKKGVK